MKIKPVIVVAGEPYSVFLEIFFKSLRKKDLKSFKKPIILVCSIDLVKAQMKKLNYNYKINKVSMDEIQYLSLNKNQINIYNIDFKFENSFDKISSKSKNYLNQCFTSALEIVFKYKLNVLINGPISKKYFLDKKYPGMTEFFASKTKKINKEVMLIHGKNLSVTPLTTHLPLKKIFKKITKKRIIQTTKTIYNFYIKYMNKKPRIALTGLNPHCETTSNFSEEKNILLPAVRNLRNNKINITGPHPADTLFIKKNLRNYDVIIGMYHDQVLTPIKTIYEFKAINITLGLPFIRITPDHGPNNEMIGKNLSNPDSFIAAINFIKKFNVN
tara:strand:+ start:409 stop:1395 length:987 start_codon:yes stop_codon:yes gene_type:complete